MVNGKVYVGSSTNLKIRWRHQDLVRKEVSIKKKLNQGKRKYLKLNK